MRDRVHDITPEENPSIGLGQIDASFPAQGSLSTRVASGAIWSATSRACLQLLYFINIAVLARKLNPQAYGLMNMTQIAFGLLSLFREVGIGSAVIQKREIDNAFLSSVSWLATGFGCAATVVCIAIAPFAAAFYRQPLVASMLRVLAISFLISSLTTVHEAMLNRQMAFRKIALVEISAAVLSLIVAIIYAYSQQGVWSLVAASLTTSIASTIGFLLAYRWFPSARFAWRHVRSVTSYGMNLSGFNIFNYFARNADNVLIGRYLGSASLGFYQFAYSIMLYPVQNVAQVLTRVLFPAFSEIQHDLGRFRQAYVRSCAIIAFISFPLMGGLAVVARPFVLVWMGPKWLPVAALIAILAPVGMFQAVGTTVGQIYMATGHTRLMFRWGLIASPFTVLSFVAGLPWGVKGVAISYAIAMTAIAFPLFLVPCRLIALPLSTLWTAVQPIVFATGLMFVTVLCIKVFLGSMSAGRMLAVCISTGVLSYALFMRLFAADFLNEVWLLKGHLTERQTVPPSVSER